MPLFIKEYGHLVRKQDLFSSEEQAVGLSSADFEFLEARLCSGEAGSDQQLFLKPSLFKGRRSLQVQNYVGVLQAPSGAQIEILPKIFSGRGQELNQDQVRNILIRMLGYLRNSAFRQSDSALLADVSIPLIEVFIGYFLQQVNKLVKRGVRSDYVVNQSNLNFMKGKILVADQIRHNVVQQYRFYVEYDEFQMNRPENRLIRSTLEKISSIVLESFNQRLCRELLFAFDHVPPSTDIRTDLGRCSRDRSMGYYAHVLDWCRIILLDQSPIGAVGNIRSISLLFPMERIFEDYVAARMRIQYPDWQVRTQVRDHYLMWKEGKNVFLMKPDLVLTKDDVRVVADTKWKLLGQDAARPIHESIGQADLYQMYAYGKKYLRDQQVKDVYLIYPKSAEFTKAIQPFEYEDNFRLFVVPYDLSLDVDRLLVGEGWLQG